ncbi:MAG: Na/Pi cotransporter family protein [Thermoanaerobaculia bacterium]
MDQIVGANLPLAALAAGDSPQGAIQPFTILITLFGGLAIFLYGLDKMSGALKAIAGEQMKEILGKLTRNRLLGALTGAFVTAVIQSSSVTTVLVVGFITAGLMSLAQSVGVIMGANIGTTVTAQIIAFKVTKYALLMVAAGFGMLFVAKREKLRQQGAGLMGLGLVFFGMSVMGEAMEPLRSFQPFLDLMIRMETPAVGILAAALFTALIQSSSATTGIVIVLASQGFITLPAGIALIFGANIGTCVTALLAAIGKPREALRASLVHVVFNVAGVLIWLPFIDMLADLVAVLSPTAGVLSGSARLAAETPRQIANAHTVFNVVNTFVFIGFSSQFARLTEKLVPDRPMELEAEVQAKYLDAELLSTPTLALDRVRLEILHLGDRVKEMVVAILPAVLTGSAEDLQQVEEMDDAVDTLHGRIVSYLGRISRGKLSEGETSELVQLMAATNDLENIGDVIETNLVALGGRRIELGLRISSETQEVIREFHATVLKALDASLVAVTQNNEIAAKVVTKMKSEINRLADSAALHGAGRLIADAPMREETYSMEMNVLENLKRIYYFTKRMCRAVNAGAKHEDVA